MKIYILDYILCLFLGSCVLFNVISGVLGVGIYCSLLRLCGILVLMMVVCNNETVIWQESDFSHELLPLSKQIHELLFTPQMWACS